MYACVSASASAQMRTLPYHAPTIRLRVKVSLRWHERRTARHARSFVPPPGGAHTRAETAQHSTAQHSTAKHKKCHVCCVMSGAHEMIMLLMILSRWPIDLTPSSLSASSRLALPCCCSTSISVSGSISSSLKLAMYCVVRGQRSTVSGQQSAVRGQWSAVSCQLSVVSGQQSAVSGQQSAVRGQRLAISGPSPHRNYRQRVERQRVASCHLSLTTYHLPPTTYHLPFTTDLTHHSLRTTHHSPRTAHHSPLTTHRSPLTTHLRQRDRLKQRGGVRKVSEGHGGAGEVFAVGHL